MEGQPKLVNVTGQTIQCTCGVDLLGDLVGGLANNLVDRCKVGAIAEQPIEANDACRLKELEAEDGCGKYCVKARRQRQTNLRTNAGCASSIL